MSARPLHHIRNNAIGYLALFVALGGTSYAALSIPKNSVGARQIRNGVITPGKLNRNVIGGSVRMWARIDSSGRLVASQPRARVVSWSSTSGASFTGGIVDWRQHVPADCFALATVESYPAPGYASTQSVTTPGTGFGTQVRIATSSPEAVDVAVIC
jgi:hypothetical protein